MPLGVRMGNLQVSGYGLFFFSSPVCMRFKVERKSLDSTVKFVFFK